MPSDLRWTDVAIICATFFGPIFAVLGQMFFEHWREIRHRRLSVFRTLLMTRASPLSPAHVEALNAVPLEFHGHREIVDAWKLYFAHLEQSPQEPTWLSKKNDLLNELLLGMSRFLGYRFNKVEVMKEIYKPVAAVQQEAALAEMQTLIPEFFRRLLATVQPPDQVDPATKPANKDNPR